jgi:hypothetical protein
MMKKSSKKQRKSVKTGTTDKDAKASFGTKGDKLNNSFATFTLGASNDPDEIDDALNPMRKSKVWNEPNYTKSIPTPLNLQSSQEYEPPLLLEDSQTPLNIEVERGLKFFDDPVRMYPMSSSPRGQVLIINNQEFDNPDIYRFRKGAHVDAENLEKLFTQLGFNVMSYKNMKRNETLKKLIEFSDIAGDKSGDMMVVCILSHGLQNGKIVTADGFVIDTEMDVLR